MEKILKAIRKNWIKVWLICAILLSVGLLATYAAYTEVNSVKRVVSTTASAGSLYSSNCLRMGTSPMRRMPSTTYPVTVCNFDQERPNTYNAADIDYKLTGTLCIKEGDKYIPISEYLSTHTELTAEEIAAINTKAGKYSILKDSDDISGSISGTPIAFSAEGGYQITFDGQSLKGGRSSSDGFKVEIDPQDIHEDNDDRYYVFVEADSTALGTMGAYLYGAYTAQETSTWNGVLVEDDANTDYDFYNYVLSGSGDGTIKIMWDDDYLEVNPFFFDTTISGNDFASGATNGIADIGVVTGGDHDGWKTVTLNVDSATKSRYEMQLYKKQPLADHASHYISFEYASDQGDS